MTGLAVDAEQAARPVLAAKIDNHRRARPQWGLSQADVVIELNVEFLTRFLALYQSRQPERIGPLRSVRTSDIPLFPMMNQPLLTWSGGNPAVTDAVRQAEQNSELVDVGAFSAGTCYRRDNSRNAPHNLVVDTTCARRTGSDDAGPAPVLFTFDETDLQDRHAGTTPDNGPFTVPMDGVTITWEWDRNLGRYRRTQDGQPHNADNQPVAFTNVIVLHVPYTPSVADARSPEAQTLGSGRVTVHRNGHYITGTWTRPTAADPFRFTTVTGTPIALEPGTTWLHLTRAT